MKAYFDTGVLLKWYVREADSTRAIALKKNFTPPLPLAELHRCEFASAISLKVFRHEATLTDASKVRADLEADLAAGIYVEVAGELTAGGWLRRAEEMAWQHAATLGVRTLDTLHVAAALELGCRDFVTNDERQARLAAAMRLNVVRL